MTWEEFIELHVPEPKTIQVEAYQGSGAYGDVYGNPADVGPCVVDDTNRRVVVQTQDTEGAEAVSSTTVLGPMSGLLSIPPGSRVTLPWNGRVTRILAVSFLDDHGLGLPEHVELNLE